jgi:hypothetical protein
MHPAMAAAATFLLVAGVAGALYVAGEGDVAQPRTPTAEALPAAAESTAATAPAEDPAAGYDVDLPKSDFNDDIVVTGELAEEPPLLIKPGSRAAGAGSKEALADKRAPVKAKPDPAKAPEPGYLDFDSKLDKAPARKRASKKRKTKGAERKPAGQPTVLGTAKDSILVETEEQELKSLEEAEARQREERVAQARAWHQKAIRAAKDNECDAVQEIGRKIRNLDSRYYDTVYLRDKRLYDCRRRTKPNAKKK